MQSGGVENVASSCKLGEGPDENQSKDDPLLEEAMENGTVARSENSKSSTNPASSSQA
jgi:hypothetical protein